MSFYTKVSDDLFLQLALLPIPKFIHENSKIWGILESQLIHQCLKIILAPLKKAAQLGMLIEDPLGWCQVCFTPLTAYIIDTPESVLMACVAGKISSVTMAYYKQFGNIYQHEPRTASTALARLQAVDPWNLAKYIKEVQRFHLNGVHHPFWHDWSLSDPSVFLTPEPLHHWCKGFWDHDAKWCILGVGSSEINFCFAVLHPHTGFCHIKEGISSLKQVTRQEHHDVEWYIVVVIIDAVPQWFLIAIKALMDLPRSGHHKWNLYCHWQVTLWIPWPQASYHQCWCSPWKEKSYQKLVHSQTWVYAKCGPQHLGEWHRYSIVSRYNRACQHHCYQRLSSIQKQSKLRAPDLSIPRPSWQIAPIRPSYCHQRCENWLPSKSTHQFGEHRGRRCWVRQKWGIEHHLKLIPCLHQCLCTMIELSWMLIKLWSKVLVNLRNILNGWVYVFSGNI